VPPSSAASQDVPLTRIQADMILNHNRIYTQSGDNLTVSVYAETQGHISLNVYNLAGDVLIKKLLDEDTGRGWSTVQWDGRNDFGDEVANDIYLVVLRANSKVVIKKIAVIKGKK